MYGYMQRMKAAQQAKAQAMKPWPPVEGGPFAEEARIQYFDDDVEHAQWIGGDDLVAPVKFEFLPHVERLPWKLLEVCEDRERQIRWFRRA